MQCFFFACHFARTYATKAKHVGALHLQQGQQCWRRRMRGNSGGMGVAAAMPAAWGLQGRCLAIELITQPLQGLLLFLQLRLRHDKVLQASVTFFLQRGHGAL